VFLELKRIEAARNIAKIIGEGQNRVFLDSDTLMMNLTQGFNQNLERKNAADLEADRAAATLATQRSEENLKKLQS
jgi:hypothetical protein